MVLAAGRLGYALAVVCLWRWAAVGQVRPGGQALHDNLAAAMAAGWLWGSGCKWLGLAVAAMAVLVAVGPHAPTAARLAGLEAAARPEDHLPPSPGKG